MLGLLDAAALKVMRRFLQRALAGERAYLVLAVAGLLAHLALRPDEPKVATEELRLGESLLVSHVPPAPTRRQRRRQERHERHERAERQAAATSAG